MKKLLRRILKWIAQSKKTSEHRSGKCDYGSLYRLLKSGMSEAEAATMGIGGEFEAIGQIERSLLVHLGLQPSDYLVDVGCGSGRLAAPLSKYLQGNYLGTDVVPSFLSHARRLVNRPEWRFELVNGLKIPEKDSQADFVCFFSVFTHLLHEQSFAYLLEARRLLKPDGRIVFSFLDFSIPSHWGVFELNINDVEANNHPLNIFLWKEAILKWADKLDMEVERFIDGDSAEIPLEHPVTYSNGMTVSNHCAFGQSVCVMRKK